MKIYINGIGSISAQNFSSREKQNEFNDLSNAARNCIEPDYKQFIPVMQLRRMSKVVKYGIAAAITALKDAGIEKPDIITTGTAYGCLADTEIFLTKMIEQKETMLTPTSFIQSTHNTVSGQIALMLSCHGHNFTYVQKGHSFECSLQEAMMWLHENNNLNILCGGIDEMTQNTFDIISRFGTYKNENDHFSTPSEGTIAGEGSNLFVLSTQKNNHSYAQLTALHLCHTENIAEELALFLQKNNVAVSDIDYVLTGRNGDSRYNETITENLKQLENAIYIDFKKWCGEYPTSGAFGVALAANILYNEFIPEQLIANDNTKQNIKNILVHNHYKNQYHSFILLQAV